MKKLFATPKRAVITTCCIFLALILIAAAVTAIVVKNSLMDRTEACDAALTDARLLRSDVNGLKAELDLDDGEFRYDVEFYSAGVEYDYIIDASDGDVISRDVDGQPQDKDKAFDVDHAGVSDQSADIPDNADSSAAPADVTVSESDALSAALKDAGLSENQVTVVKSKLDYDDGVKVYDIEFYTDTKEYDYEINAATSAIVSRSSENLPSAGNTGNNGGNNNTTISESDALSAALKDAGLSKSQVTVVKSKLDYDDGVKVYDIEFYSDGMEYEYEINAANGAILDRSKERA